MDAVAVKTNKGGVEQEFWRLKPKKKKRHTQLFFENKKDIQSTGFLALETVFEFSKVRPNPTAYSLKPKKPKA
jgi:hypothetical protein